MAAQTMKTKLQLILFVLVVCCLMKTEQANCGFHYSFGDEWRDGSGLSPASQHVKLVSPSSSHIDQNLDKYRRKRDSMSNDSPVGSIQENSHKHVPAKELHVKHGIVKQGWNNIDIPPSQTIQSQQNSVYHKDKNNRIENRKWLEVTKTFLPPLKQRSHIERRMKSGRITCDFGTYTHNTWHSVSNDKKTMIRQQSKGSIHDHQEHDRNHSSISLPQRKRQFAQSNFSSQSSPSFLNNTENANIEVSLDPGAIGRLSVILFCAASSLGSAFMGTLRLLAPLVVSRRVLVFIGTLVSDWYAGRYFRKTFTRIEKIYIHYYETPATFRAISRSMSQLIVYLTLARIMGWLVGITHPPCRSEGRGLAFLCGLLWLGSVVGTGHAFSTAVALWGGPLRLQAANHPKRTSVKTILRRPWYILQWMQNPEQWVSLLAIPERRPFDPNPIAFPVTWAPLRIIQMIGVAAIASTEPSDYLWCSPGENQLPTLMKQYLFQLALCDEWYRVFIKEKRLGLGIFVASAYSLAMVSLIITSVGMNGTASLLLVPSLLALILSTWLNLVIYCNRYTRKKTKPVFTPINSL